jgi:hypothetical protein
MMEHRGIEYNIVQGLGPHLWKWFVTTGRAESTGHVTIAQKLFARPIEFWPSQGWGASGPNKLTD